MMFFAFTFAFAFRLKENTAALHVSIYQRTSMKMTSTHSGCKRMTKRIYTTHHQLYLMPLITAVVSCFSDGFNWLGFLLY